MVHSAGVTGPGNRRNVSPDPDNTGRKQHDAQNKLSFLKEYTETSEEIELREWHPIKS